MNGFSIDAFLEDEPPGCFLLPLARGRRLMNNVLPTSEPTHVPTPFPTPKSMIFR
jgi:hypothetical protein